MKKCIALMAICLLISGCSWNSLRKFIDQMDWERDDQTIRAVYPVLK
ncbi:MAG: hypothetical protein AB1646_05050 [Thermodesulfobacteriota bacterium]